MWGFWHLLFIQLDAHAGKGSGSNRGERPTGDTGSAWKDGAGEIQKLRGDSVCLFNPCRPGNLLANIWESPGSLWVPFPRLLSVTMVWN